MLGSIRSLSPHVRAHEPSRPKSKRCASADAKTIAGIDISYTKNLVDPVWGSARPERPKNPVFAFDIKYAGRDHKEKLGQVRQELEKHKARALVVTMLDEVAWLFNLRGSDIEFNPVFFGYTVVSADRAILFIDPAQVGQDVHSQLGQDVELRPYNEFIPYLKELGAGLQVQSPRQPH